MILLPSLDEWKLTEVDKRIKIVKILEQVIANLTVDLTTINDVAPRFIKTIDNHKIFFRLVFSHNFTRGLTKNNEESLYKISSAPPITIDEMKPTILETTNAFLICETPLTNKQVRNLANIEVNDDICFPAYLEYSKFEEIIHSFHIDFPTEIQWECAIRANESTLFPFGNDLDSVTNLEMWMNFNLCASNLPQNKFGLKGLFFGEWCSDDFKINLSKNSKTVVGSKTVRGGGAYFWPWQDSEWVWCITAMRMPSRDLIDGVAVCRPVINF